MKKEGCIFTCDICGKSEVSFDKYTDGPGYKEPKDWCSNMWILGVREICPDCYRRLLCFVQEMRPKEES